MYTLNLHDKWYAPLLQSLLLVSTLIWADISEAGGWLRSEGEHRYGAHLQGSSSDKSWDRFGNDEISSCTSKNRSLTHEYEYGYSYYRTYFGKISMASSDCADDKVSGFSDLYLGVRGRLNLYKNGNAWEAIIIIPTGYDNKRSNRLGYGEVGLDLGLYGTTKITEKSSINYGGSLRFWAGAPADQLRAKVSWSHRYNDTWSYSASLAGNFSLNNSESDTFQSISGDFESEFDVIRAEFGVRRRLSRRLGVGAGIFKTLWGRDTSQRQGLFINLGYVWGRR
jgi:hypothetical protein